MNEWSRCLKKCKSSKLLRRALVTRFNRANLNFGVRPFPYCKNTLTIKIKYSKISKYEQKFFRLIDSIDKNMYKYLQRKEFYIIILIM